MEILDFRDRQKVCHVCPGECVRLFSKDGEEQGLFLVCSAGELKSKLGSSGLYKADVPVFLVDLKTGVARDLPHLSSRLLEVVRDAKITLQQE